MVSFRGQKKLGPLPDRSPLGFNSKFPTSIPTPFTCGVSPPRDMDLVPRLEKKGLKNRVFWYRLKGLRLLVHPSARSLPRSRVLDVTQRWGNVRGVLNKVL